MKSIEEQLSDATASITSLQADATANADLLTEAQAKVTAAEAQVATLAADLEKATTDAATFAEGAKAELEAKTAEIALAKTASEAEVAALKTEVEALKASAKTAEAIAAERYGAGGPPANIPVRGGPATDEALVAKFQAISNPAEQTAFWRGLTDAQKAVLVAASK